MDHRSIRTTLLLLALGLVPLAACNDDGDDPAAAVPTSAATDNTDHTDHTDHAAGHPTVTIGLRDYAFDDVPDTVPVGTPIGVVNRSTEEVHELIAVRLADDETRSLLELSTLPPAELGALIGPAPAAVLVAPPGGEGRPVVGDGTLQEPGRYLLVCMIPIGADPQEYLAAAASGDGPPQVDGGPPHVTGGMIAELVVTA